MIREKTQRADCLGTGLALMRRLAAERPQLQVVPAVKKSAGESSKQVHSHSYWEFKVVATEEEKGSCADIMYAVPPGVFHGITRDASLTAVVSAQRIGWYHGIYGQYVMPDMRRFETRQLFGMLNLLRLYAERHGNPPRELGRALSSALLSAMEEFWKHARSVQQNYSTEAIAKDYLASHLSDPDVGLSELALCVGCSKRRLLYSFGKQYGLSPMQLLTKMRMQQARRLLEQRDSAIQDVAIACGYRSRDYFSRVFTRENGCTPAEFRRDYSSTMTSRSVPVPLPPRGVVLG